jgi:hypothetical protein
MRTRTLAERLTFSASIIFFGLTLAGTKSCQEDYNFAVQSNATAVPSRTTTPTPDDDDDDDDDLVTVTPTIAPSVTSTASGVVTATPTVGTASVALLETQLIETLRSVSTRTANEEAARAAKLVNPYAEALKGKPENWIGKAFSEEPLKAVVDSDGDGFSDWLEILMGSNPNDAASTPPAPVSDLRSRLGIDGQSIEERLRSFEDVTSDNSRSDADKDGLRDNLEVAIGSDPNNPDTDQDGVWDGREFYAGADPLRPEASVD